ncbi:MAG TPA: dienelactone hydrolase family protein [Phycisphaerales bacterium]|nr:dienelactone hydrolase family protein [Phycisphaerales bacterium]HMP38612.1 dienelactone hydrolase family protein [Phycisphaerales bacterium]
MDLRLAPVIVAIIGLFASVLTPTHAAAAVQSEVIEYEHGGTTFRGEIFWDDARSGKRPGVLVVHEWWGCNDYAKRRAEQLAELGYVAFACDMYGGGTVVDTVEAARPMAMALYNDRALLRARATAGLQQLAGFRFVDPERLAAIGYCFGGTVCLELARSGADLAAIGVFHGGLSTPMPAEPGAIKGEVLVLNGAEDPAVPVAERSAFMEEMRNAKAIWTFVEFGGAIHSFSNPEAARRATAVSDYNERADRQSWGMLRELLARRLGAPGARGS